MQTNVQEKVNHAHGQGKTVSLFSKWVDGSQVRVRVRHICRRGKLKMVMVDLFELSPEGSDVPREQLNHIAIEAAMINGAEDHDFCVYRDFQTYRKCNRLNGTVTYTNIREKSYAFRGMS